MRTATRRQRHRVLPVSTLDTETAAVPVESEPPSEPTVCVELLNVDEIWSKDVARTLSIIVRAARTAARDSAVVRATFAPVATAAAVAESAIDATTTAIARSTTVKP